MFAHELGVTDIWERATAKFLLGGVGETNDGMAFGSHYGGYNMCNFWHFPRTTFILPIICERISASISVMAATGMLESD